VPARRVIVPAIFLAQRPASRKSLSS
jgi:hypothetical protein